MLSCEIYEVFKNIYERVLLRFLWCFLESFFAAGYLSLTVMMMVIMMMILFKFDIESFKTIFKNIFFYKTSPVAAFKTRHQKTRDMPEQQKCELWAPSPPPGGVQTRADSFFIARFYGLLTHRFFGFWDFLMVSVKTQFKIEFFYRLMKVV